ncbi:MAG TPA: glycosyltransferase family 4 protein [Abditibacterium sp.]|jgi:glycosyltransferase involved in cell wall biosynthesis
MSPRKQLAFAAYGDPFDPVIWSGTPVNLASALQKLDVEIIGLNCDPLTSKWKWDLIRRTGKWLGGHEVNYIRRGLGRKKCAELAATLPAECVGVMHMSSLTVPKAGSTPGVRHFLLCDSMDNYWRTFAPDDQATPRQKRESERHEREAVAATELFFPISEHAAANLRDYYGVKADKITVVGTGRGQIEPLRGTKDYSRKNILMVAKLRFEDKGGPLLLEALQIARKTDPQLHLTLVSPDEFRPFVQGMEGVTITGRVEWSELQRLFDEACLYAMPALCEPWGLVYAEALATKTPILGLNRAALPELTNNGEYGILVDEATPQAVAAALLEAVSNPQKLQQMGEAGQKYCLDAFSWDRTAARVFHRLFESNA